jgi:hypothetical protein
MRNLRHDYGRKNGGWWAEHGEALWTPKQTGPLLTINGYAPLQSEVLLIASGLIEKDRIKWQNWRMGDPKLPDPDFNSILQELSVLTMEQTMAYLRNLDTNWDVHDAERNRRRYGTE